MSCVNSLNGGKESASFVAPEFVVLMGEKAVKDLLDHEEVSIERQMIQFEVG